MSSAALEEALPGSAGKRLPPELERLQDRLSCAVCLSRYEDPRMLKCRHSFCRKCLDDLLARGKVWDPDDPLDDMGLTCPKCRGVTELGEGGVIDLPINFDLCDAVEEFVHLAEAPHVFPSSSPRQPRSPSPSSSSAPASPLIPRERSEPAEPQCPMHNQSLEYFCKDCSKLICVRCHIDSHRNHQLELPKDTLAECVAELQENCLEMAQRMCMNLEIDVIEIQNVVQSLEEQRTEMKQSVQKNVSEIVATLRAREQFLLSLADQVVREKVTKLQEQEALLRSARDELLKRTNELNAELAKPNNILLLRDRDRYVNCIEAAVGCLKESNRSPCESLTHGPHLYIDKDFVAKSKKFGAIFNNPCPKRFLLSGECLEKAFLGKESEFKVLAHDNHGFRSYRGGYEVEAVVTGPSYNVATPLTVTDNGMGEYTVSFTPREVGYHTFNVTVDGKVLGERQPLSLVLGKRDYSALDKPLKRIDKQDIEDPNISTFRAVCSLPGDQIAFADAFSVKIIGANGTLESTIGSFGTGPGQFKLPIAICVASNKTIFVTDTSGHRIQKFSLDGRLISTVGTRGNRHGCFEFPEGISLLKDEKLYVADRGNDRIQVFKQSNLRFVKSFGSKGDGAGMLNSPRDVLVDTIFDRLLVSDEGNDRIQFFTLLGQPLESINSPLTFLPLSSPSSLAMDADGFIAVVLKHNQAVAILTPQGKLVRCVGLRQDHFWLPLKTPQGVCFNEQHQVIVSDTSSQCLFVF